jgi:hypothetical protein
MLGAYEPTIWNISRTAKIQILAVLASVTTARLCCLRPLGMPFTLTRLHLDLPLNLSISARLV